MESYKYCGSSQTGESHIKTGTGCQDFSCFGESNGVFIAAVADGLSSSVHSDVASRIAAKVAVDYCLKRIKSDTNSSLIIEILKKAFDEALFAVKNIAKDAVTDYDTTLSVAVFISGDVYTGQVGDSSIIALREDGLFDCVTQTQNGEGEGKDRPTFPLGATQMWVFEKYGFKAKALYLATDGVLNKIMPPRLENQEWPFDNKYLAYLYSNINNNACGDSDKRWINDEISRISPDECNHDDKSLIIVISEDVHLNAQASEYYHYPDEKLWTRLGIEWEERLYPYKRPPTPPKPNSRKGKEGDSDEDHVDIPQGPTKRPTKRTSITNRRIFAIAGAVALLLITILVFSPGKKADDNNKDQQIFTESVYAPDVDMDIVYDGKAHGIEEYLSSKYKNAVVHFGYNDKEYDESQSPQITNVQDSPLTIYYLVSCRGQKDIYGKAIITISPFNFENLQIYGIKDQTYSANEITQDIQLFIGKYKLMLNKDYNLIYSDNINVGTASVQILPEKGNSNFCGEKTLEFDILKATPIINIDNVQKFDVENRDYKLPSHNDAKGVNGIAISGTTTWYLDIECSKRANEKDLPNESGAQRILYCKFTPSNNDQRNYKEIVIKVTFIAVETGMKT